MIRFYLVYIITVTLCFRAEAQTWSLLPVDATGCSSIIEDPHQHGTLYFTHQGTIARTTNNGEDWDYINLSTYVDALPVTLTIDRSRSGTWYLPVGHSGVVRTTNNGGTFTFVNSGLALDEEYRQIYQHPDYDGYIYLRSDRRIWLSTNYGDTWTKPLLSVNPFAEELEGLVFDSHNPSRIFVFADGQHQTYVTTNGGLSWTTINRPHDVFTRIILNSDGDLWINNYSSTDYGASWVKHTEVEGSSDPCNGMNAQVVYDPSTETYFLAAQKQGIYRKRKGDSLWIPTSLIRKESEGWYSNFNWMFFDSTNGFLWVLFGNRLLRSSDAGDSYQLPSGGPYLGNTAFIESSTPASDIIVLSTGVTFDNGRTWKVMEGEKSGQVGAAAVSPLDSSVLLIGYDGGTLHFTTRGLLDYGSQDKYYWTVPVEPPALYVYRTISFNPHNPHQILGGGNYGLWAIGDSLLFDPLQNEGPFSYLTPIPPSGYYVLDLEFHPESDGYYYLLTLDVGPDYSTRLRVSDDYGKTWETILTIEGYTGQSVIVHPMDPNLILVTTGCGIYRSTDGGRTWTKPTIPTGLTSFAGSLLIDPGCPGRIYCGFLSTNSEKPDINSGSRQGGVAESTDYGATWSAVPLDGMHNYSIRSMHYHENPRRIMVSTSAGIYQMLLPNSPVTAQAPSRPTSKSLHIDALYPNPTDGASSVTFGYTASHSQTVNISVVDLLGRVCFHRSIRISGAERQTVELPTEPLLPGFYVVRIQSGNEASSRMLLIGP